MRLLIKWLVNAIAVFLTANLLPGVHVDSFMTAILVALVLGIVNVIIKPILLLLTLPITIFTLGLFTLVVNTLMVLLTAWLVKGFTLDGFLYAFLFSIVLSLISSFLQQMVKG